MFKNRESYTYVPQMIEKIRELLQLFFSNFAYFSAQIQVLYVER